MDDFILQKGISSVQLGENIKVSQKTAWFMMHRIRKALGIDNDVGSEDEGGGGKLSGTVEIDETFNWRKRTRTGIGTRKFQEVKVGLSKIKRQCLD